MKRILFLTKTLLAAVLLCVGQNAWAQVTPYSNDYEDATPNVDWVSGNTGRYTVAVEGTTDHYLHVGAVSNGNNGTTITCSATNGKVTTGTDFYMSFDLILEGSNSSGQHSTFYIYDKNNNADTPILKIYQNDGSNYTGWTINDNTALTTGGKGTGNWYNYVLTRIGTKEYLTVTKKSDSSKVFDMVELTNLSNDGGLGNMQFATAKYYAGMYIDNVMVRALVAPAFTLSTTEVTPEVGGSATVDVTGITGTVSVTSDNTSAATASYSDGKITINGIANGVAYITVTAVNDGAKTTQTIMATVGAVSTTTVTVNYLCGGSPIAEATTIEDVAIGSTLTASDITYSETIAGVGCRYADPSFSVDFPYTVEEDGVINVNYTQQNAVSSLNVYANVNSTNYLLKSYELDGKYVGDVVTITYPEYYLLDGTLYSTPKDTHGENSYYKWKNYTLAGNSVEIPYGTTAATNVVYYAEAENIEGATANSSSNADIRCSEATGAYFGAETNVVTLPAGSYTIYTKVWGGTGVTYTFKAGESTIHENATTGSLNPGNSSFDLSESKTITVSASGSSGKVLDLVYIVKTADIVKLNSDGYATYSAKNDVEVSGATAYTAVLDFEKSKITCTEITSDKIPAGNGVLLYGEPDANVTLSITTGAADLGSNNLKATTLADGTLATMGSNDYYALSGDTFMKYTGAEFAANKAYFEVAEGTVQARAMRITFDGITGVANVEATEAKAQEGKFIENGKLVIVKNGVKYNAAGQQVK